MSFHGKTKAFGQFKVVRNSKSSIDPKLILEQLSKKRFHSIDGTTDLEAEGWLPIAGGVADFTSPDLNILQSKLYVTYRADKKQLPGVVVKEYLQKEKQQWLQQNPDFSKVPRTTTSELREKVLLSLGKTAIPVPKIVQLVWDFNTDVVSIFTSSLSMLEKVADFFKETFDEYRLIYITPYDRCRKLLDTSQLEDFMKISNTPPDADVLVKLSNNSWILQDLFLWLFQKTYDGETTFQIENSINQTTETIVSWINSGVLLEKTKGTSEPYSMRISNVVSPYAELCSGLRQGGLISSAKINWVLPETDQEFLAGLTSKTGIFSGVRCPEYQLDTEMDSLEAFEGSLLIINEQLNEFIQLFEKTLQQFLIARLDENTWKYQQQVFLETYVEE